MRFKKCLVHLWAEITLFIDAVSSCPRLNIKSKGKGSGRRDSRPPSGMQSGEREPLGKAHLMYINVWFSFPKLLRQCAHTAHASLCEAHAPHCKGQMILSTSTNLTVTKMKSDSSVLRTLWTDTLKPVCWQQRQWGWQEAIRVWCFVSNSFSRLLLTSRMC